MVQKMCKGLCGASFGVDLELSLFSMVFSFSKNTIGICENDEERTNLFIIPFFFFFNGAGSLSPIANLLQNDKYRRNKETFGF